MKTSKPIEVLLHALPPLAWLWGWVCPPLAPPPEPVHPIVAGIKRLELRSQPGFAYPLYALPTTSYRLRVLLRDGRTIDYDDEQYLAFRDRVRRGRLEGSDAESLDQILSSVLKHSDDAIREKQAGGRK